MFDHSTRIITFALCLAAVLLFIVGLFSGVPRVSYAATSSLRPIDVLAGTDAQPVTPSCASIDRVLAAVKQAVPDATHEVLTGPAAVRYAKAFDALPPASNSTVPDTIIAFSAKSQPSVYINGFVGGCRVSAGHLTPQQHKSVLAKINETI